MADIIRVFEHEKLCLHSDRFGQKLTRLQLDKLYEFNDRNRNKYFTPIRDGVKFAQYVGVIRMGSLTIEILPKTDRDPTTDKGEYMIWQTVLVKMLRYCHEVNLNTVSDAFLRPHHGSILELYFRLYLDELSLLIRQGLIKAYHHQESNTNALKGRLLFARNLRQNLVHRERFYTRHQVYDFEHRLNQILLRALSVLSGLASNSDLGDYIQRVRLSFPEIKETNITKHDFDLVRWTRKNEGYRKAVNMARMIILNYSPDIRRGSENMLALLFDMNKLWEEFVYRSLKRMESPAFSVGFQNRMAFWNDRQIRPDLVLRFGNQVSNDKRTIILDTKWKLLENDKDNASDNDLKQMFAYNIYWNTGESILLYPGSQTREIAMGRFHKGRPDENTCRLMSLNILSPDGRLKTDAGEELHALLLNPARG